MRSKTLLIGNILSSVWGGGMLVYLCSFLVEGGWETLTLTNQLAYVLSEISDAGAETVIIVDVIMVLLFLHVVLFAVGGLLGWIGYVTLRNGFTKAAAVLYTIATILFPVSIPVALPIVIIGFVGHSRQKKKTSRV